MMSVSQILNLVSWKCWRSHVVCGIVAFRILREIFNLSKKIIQLIKIGYNVYNYVTIEIVRVL